MKRTFEFVRDTLPYFRMNFACLFGLNTITSRHNEVVLTGNELDAMAVAQVTKLPALALPKGDSSLPLKVRALLCKKIKVIS